MGRCSTPARESTQIQKKIHGPNTRRQGMPPLSLEKRLRTIEGGDKYGLEAVDLCLVLDVGLPTDFKTLEFDKYKGSSCPRVQLAMYCQKMATYIYDDKVLIHCFQDSLIGAALSWYVNLERKRIKTCRDLAEAFLKQYKYNEKEMVTMLIDTLPSSYYNMILRNVASNFADLMVVGERIELGIQQGKFAQTSNSTSFTKKPTLEKKKREANVVLIEPIFPQTKANTSSYSTRI
ncbi:hypothetical protein CR513_10382, partial [Mucuna pruriens]